MQQTITSEFQLPVDNYKVMDRVIDVYLWLDGFNTAEVSAVGEHLIRLAERRATDIELFYVENRRTQCELMNEYVNDIPLDDLPF